MVVHKNKCNGSVEIVDALKQKGIKPFYFKRMVFCGVEANVCVQETIHGLLDIYKEHKRLLKVSLIKDAVRADPFYSSGGIEWDELERKEKYKGQIAILSGKG